MSIKKLIEAIDSDNLVESIRKKDKGDEILLKLGRRVCRNHAANESSMTDWTDLIESGLDIAKFENKGESYPWEGAANFKSPLITEAVRGFGDRAKTEIMKSDTLVATKLVGKEDDQKKQSMDNIDEHMNWQINTEMKTWREEHTKMLYLLSAQGATFKKTFYDATEGCNKSSIIRYPNFSINQECDNLGNSNFTEIRRYWPNDIWSNQESGLWIDDEIVKEDSTNDEINEDDYEFLEQFCDFDLDGDGYEEPLIVTVHKMSEKVVRIVPRWDVEGVHVVYEKATYNLAELVKASTVGMTEDQAFNDIQALEKMNDIQSKAKMVRIEPMDILTNYGFIEPTDGSYLSIGYLHLLGSTVKGINKGTNALFNAGELANLQGGWLSKEHRDKKRGPFRTKAGSFKQTNISAQNLAGSVHALPFKEPSPTLLSLITKLEDGVKNTSSQFNYEQALSPNIPAASVLGVLQEGIIPTSSLLMNVVNAMSKEFQILFTLNQKFTDPLIYQTITGSKEYAADYTQDIEITPTANAQFSNQMQKIQLATAQMEQIPVVQQMGGNAVPIIKNYFEALGSPNMDAIFPDQMSDEDQKVNEQMMQAQTAQTEAMNFQNELLKAQVDQGNMNLEIKAKESDAKIAEMTKESERKDAELLENLQKIKAETLLKYEEAQTEDTKNNHKMQMDQIDMLIRLTEPSS